MPVAITKQDLKTQVSINLELIKLLRSGPLVSAAIRLTKLWVSQLPEDVRRDIEIAESIDLSAL